MLISIFMCIMASKTITLNKDMLKEIIRKALKEALLLEEKEVCPTLKHTNNAFKEGEIVYMHMQRKRENGRVEWADDASKILKVEPNDIIIDYRGKKYRLSKQYEKLRCSDTWWYIFSMMNKGEEDGVISSGDVKFDYQVVNGEDSVVVTMKNGLKNPITFRYRYDDVRNAMRTRSDIKAIPMKVATEEANTGLWLKEGQVIPSKSKNPMPDAVEVKRDWVVSRVSGNTFHGSVFEGWNINAANEIVNACPWMAEKPAWWLDVSNSQRTKKKTIPSQFNN